MSTPTQEKATQDPGAPQQPSLLRRVLTGIGVQNSSLIITLIALVILLPVLNDNFFRTNNLVLIGRVFSILGLLVLVQSRVLIVGGLDISVGSMAGLASVVSAMVFT